MVLLHLMGGLGNQMSQVAFAYVIGRRNNQFVEVETTSYKTYKRRPCSIQKLELDRIIGVNSHARGLYFRWSRFNQELYHVIIRLLFHKREQPKSFFSFLQRFNHIYSCDSTHLPLRSFKHNVDIYGYYLIEPYFREYYSDICKMFEVKKEFLSDEVTKYENLISTAKCPIAISLRLQDDYRKDPIMYVCTPEYFKRGVDILKEKHPDATYFIFADDIEMAKQFDLGISPVYIESMNDVEGMHLMRKCHHFVISNSSFSWWGAYLSSNPNKNVIAPNRWINNNKDYAAKYYSNMIKIDAK